MSTRCNVIIKNQYTKIILYRHSDGYPSCTGADLKEFIKDYTGKMRLDPMQSAGWLIVRGHKEYANDSFMDWKVGAYEPTDRLHEDIEFVYIIDTDTRTLEMRQGRKMTSKVIQTTCF